MLKQENAVATVEILILEKVKINHKLSILANPVTTIKTSKTNAAKIIRAGLTISFLFVLVFSKLGSSLVLSRTKRQFKD